MTMKKLVETFDLLLSDLTNTNIYFGGKVIILGQTLPVVKS